VLVQRGETDRADALLQELLPRLDRLADDHPENATALAGLASALHMRGREVEAEALYRRICEMNRNTRGVRPETAGLALSNLAFMLAARNQHDEVEALFREAIELNRSAGQPADETARAMSGLVGVLRKQGKLAEAEQAAREALALLQELVGNTHPRYLAALSELAGVLLDAGRPAGAEPLYREALQIESQLPRTRLSAGQRARILAGLGESLTLSGRATEAEPVLREALDLLNSHNADPRRGAADPRRSAMTTHLLGMALLELNRFEEAEPLLVGAAEALLSDPRGSGDLRRKAVRGVVTLCERWAAAGDAARAQQAETWRQRLPATP
jgi:tetratricopeptide (TPR) repeat protein